MKKKNINIFSLNKIVGVAARESIIALSIYLCDLFILKSVNSLNYTNSIFWAILLFVCFEKLGICKELETTKTKVASRLLRGAFLLCNFILFGINIFT